MTTVNNAQTSLVFGTVMNNNSNDGRQQQQQQQQSLFRGANENSTKGILNSSDEKENKRKINIIKFYKIFINLFDFRKRINNY